MGGLQLDGLLGDGTMIVSRNYNPVFSSKTRLERDPITYLRVSTDGSPDTIATVAGSDVFLFAGSDFSSRRELAFGRLSFVAVGSDGIFTATGDSWQIEHRAPDGRVRAIYRVRHTPAAVTRAEIATYRSELIERMKNVRVQATGGSGGPDMREAILAQERMLDVMPFPSTHAPYDSLMLSATKELWVRTTAKGKDGQRTWVVLRPDGAARGVVRIPPGMKLLHIGADFIVAMTRDEDDVQHVGMYALRAGPG
jgi:hypothetical protein